MHGGLVLFVLGVVLIALGTFVIDSAGVQVTAIVIGAGLAALGVFWPRIEGLTKLGPSGLEMIVAQAAQENGLSADERRELIARVEALERPVRTGALAEAMRESKERRSAEREQAGEEPEEQPETHSLAPTADDRREILRAVQRIQIDPEVVRQVSKFSEVMRRTPEMHKALRILGRHRR